MDPFQPEPDDAPIPPAPPRSIPPAPPPAELVRPSVPHVPLTPMMDFFARRLEALERELEIEKEKARAAQSQIEQQETLRGDVETNLKAINDQLRREKAEREAEEAKSHARGRIDVLEKRLDEMHQSWVSLLKDAVTQRDAGSQAVAKEQGVISQEQSLLRNEVSSLTGAVARLMEQIGQWRTDTQAFVKLLPEMRQLSQDLPQGARRFEGEVADMLGQFSSELRERMSSWQRQQETEAQRQSERLRSLTQERETLLRQWQEAQNLDRLEREKERAGREGGVDDRLGALAQRFSEIMAAQERAAADTVRMREELTRAIAVFNTPPKAKDQVIAGLELERADLLKALQDRTASLQKFIDERRGIEKTMGESLALLHRDLDAERDKQRALAARFNDLEFDNAKLNDRLSLKDRELAGKDERFATMAAERDEVSKAVLAEHERFRAHFAAQAEGEESWRAKLAQMEQRVTAEIELRAREATAVSELRVQISVLADQLTKAVQEKDAALARFSDWDGERQKLLAALRQKDETISMLNGAFQNMLKKG